MFCLAHRQLGLPDLIHPSSSPWSACLVRRSLGQRPGSGQDWPAAWGDHKRHQKTTSAWSRQMNVFIYLSSPPTSLSTNSIHCLAVDETKGKCWEGWGCPPPPPRRRGPSCTRNLSSLLGGRLFSFTTLTRPISRIEVAWCFDSSFACAFVPRRSLPNGY